MSLRDVRLRQALMGIMLGGALTAAGCASTGPKEIQAEPAAEAAAPAASAVSVEYIDVVGEGDRVLIGTTGPVKFTVFKLSSPSRLIVDMPGIDLEKVAKTLAVGNDYVGEITTAVYGENKDIGRIVIGLREGIDHEVKSSENSILVSLNKGDQEAGEAGSLKLASADAVIEETLPETAAAPAEGQAEPDGPAAVSEAAKAEPETIVEKTAPAKKATKVTGLETASEGENTVIKVLTDGLAGNHNAFVLAKPARIVLDVWGVRNSTGKDARNLNDKYVKTVRIGSYPDKARFVFDAKGEKLPPHSVRVENGAIVLTVGPGALQAAAPAPAVTAALQAKPEAQKPAEIAASAPEIAAAPALAEPLKEPEAAKPEEVAASSPALPAVPAISTAAEPASEKTISIKDEVKGTNIDRIDYARVGDKGRLTIAGASKLEYRTKESKDGKTIALDIKGAVIPDTLVRTLDASKLKTPVASVSSYQDSVSPSSVRVLVKLKDKAAYNVQEAGNSIVVDFTEAAAATDKAVQAEPAAPVVSETSAISQELAEAKRYNGKKVNLDMMDANIADVLRLLAEVSGMNIIASDDVKGTISLRLKNVPWDQAFDIIMKSKGLDSVQEGNVIRVAPAQRIRQENEALLAAKKAGEKLEDMEIEFVAVNFANADELKDQVKSVLTDRGEVTTDKRTNTLVIRDIRKGIDAAKNVITKLDTPIPQVLIEARIVEASSSFARDLGIQWGVDYSAGNKHQFNTLGSSSSFGSWALSPDRRIIGIAEEGGAFPLEKKEWPSRPGVSNYAVNLPATGTAGPLGAFGFMFGKIGANPLILDLRLTAGETQGQLKTISRPRVTTLDNREAKIEQGESIPFETTSAAGTATTFIDANLSLTVTPHITPDGSVLMRINASRNSIGTFRTSGGQPSINKKEATTDVLVKDGETTVIGGIVITDKNNSERGIPFLKDIPVLGWLFKSKSVADTQTELLIFITPKILKEKTIG
ncbi:MAG: type IV pilus secretin PilQ [Deltaproteobacteria bacterium]|nr:type IV pilus secretin PilQ [Deltaproteobacteria bacterium]MBZ0221243.1 type IV pilus secretin PilQ [Deltaproteobacteria bacterium]